jgi:hypothetical protein
MADAQPGDQRTDFMADFKFSCPHCAISVECDELWCGHEIQCPSCQKEFMVPQKPAGPPHATFAKAPQGQSRLSIGQSQAQRASAPPPVAPQVLTLQEKLNQAKAGQKGSAMKWVTISIVVVVLGVGGYFGYGFFTKWQAKRAEAAKLASAPPPATNAAPAEPAPPPPPKELPVLPAVWTLDVEQAKIPEGKANGTISGTNFVVESAMCTPQVLRLYQGASVSPDREVLLYLRLNPGESLTNHNWTVSKDMRGKGVPQVVKRWKTNPRYAPQARTFSSGYAMKLELGQVTSNLISGKIFLALPDTEQSVVAGQFKALTTLAPAAPSGEQPPVVAPGPAPPSPERSAFDKRYGTKR